MSHPPEISEGQLCKPGSLTPLSQVLCQLHEDNGKEHEYRCWQDTLETTSKPWDLWHLTPKIDTYILKLSEGRRDLVSPSARVENIFWKVMKLQSSTSVRELAEQLAPGTV